VIEGVFSVDGDVAPLKQVAELAVRHQALLLVVDEAHAVFEPETLETIDGLQILRVGTLSETFGSLGGWVSGPRNLIELVNRARLRRSIDRLHPRHPSPIIPVILGEESAALAAADRLFRRGIHVPAIRPPTVAPGKSRLRLSLSALHDDAAIEQLREALRIEGIAL
jgi:7-keto-8-aminopelargonate synthetase-like enzyme